MYPDSFQTKLQGKSGKKVSSVGVARVSQKPLEKIDRGFVFSSKIEFPKLIQAKGFGPEYGVA